MSGFPDGPENGLIEKIGAASSFEDFERKAQML
jgi:hypothetical protein